MFHSVPFHRLPLHEQSLHADEDFLCEYAEDEEKLWSWTSGEDDDLSYADPPTSEALANLALLSVAAPHPDLRTYFSRRHAWLCERADAFERRSRCVAAALGIMVLVFLAWQLQVF